VYTKSEDLLMLVDEFFNWAKEEALTQWQGEEGKAALWFQNTPINAPENLTTFRRFLYKWRISRTLGGGNSKQQTLDLLLTKYRDKWKNLSILDEKSKFDAFETVQVYANTVRDNGWTPRNPSPWTPTSYASKAAFMCNPTLFAPYDKFVRIALRRRGFIFADHNYCQYMTAFNSVAQELSDAIEPAANEIVKKFQIQNDQTVVFLNNQTAKLRIMDKYLMREGGF
jgi:hypothetical protein